MKIDLWGAVASFAVTFLGLFMGLWQGAALAGIAGGCISRTRPILSAVTGTGAGWLLFLGIQMSGSGGRVANALGTALGLPGGALVFVILSLVIALVLALLGAVVGRGLGHGKSGT